MAEMIDIYTKDGKKIGIMSKKDYYKTEHEDIPWINCCTCFVIDDNNKKILFEKRGNRFLDPGKLDLCSGHVKSGEISAQSMIRELNEELSIPENIGCNLHHLGNVNVDYTELKDETNRKKLKCFVSVFALKMKDISCIQIDNKEAISIGWLNLEDTIGFIKNSMTRMPYEDCLVKDYETIFNNLENYLNIKNKNDREEIK